jgi:hypothetical protein
MTTITLDVGVRQIISYLDEFERDGEKRVVDEHLSRSRMNEFGRTEFAKSFVFESVISHPLSKFFSNTAQGFLSPFTIFSTSIELLSKKDIFKKK